MAEFILWVKKFLGPICLLFSILIFLTNILLPSLDQITHGFAAYYAASHLVVEHRSGSILYDDNAFQAEVQRATHGQANDIYWANPPTTALMFLPITTFPVRIAHRLWIGILLVSLFLATTISGLVILRTPFQTKLFYIATSILFLSAPVAANFQFGQAYIFLFLIYAIALFAMYSGLEWLAGCGLALALALKASGLPLLLLFVIRGKWRLVMWVLLAFTGLTFLSLSLVGLSTWQVYLFHVLPRFLSDPVIAVTAYQTLPGFIRHLFTYDRIWNPGPLANWPTFASLANLLVSCVIVGVAVARSRRTSLQWSFCVGLLLGVILVPVAEQHHYVLLFPAFLLAAHSPSIPKGPLFFAGALITLPFDYTAEALSHGWWTLFAYPRLYGAILLLVMLLHHYDHPTSLNPRL